MFSKGFHIFALLSACALASPTRHYSTPEFDITVKRVPRSEIKLYKRSFDVNSYSALGDSFSAGPSAGDPLTANPGDYDCSRYSAAFPEVLNADPRLSGPSDRAYQFLACTGAVMPDVVNTQLPAFDSSANLVTLTIGGNDVGFASILKTCIYGIRVWPWSWGCPDLMQWSRDQMTSTTWHSNYDSILQGIWDADSNANIYIVGYPAFFNVDTDQCSGTCFSWGLTCGPDDYLTRQKRQDMNDLVALLNTQIQDAIGRNPPPDGSQGTIQFIDTNPSYNTHRFCEDGVTEPDYNNPNIWFYPWTYTKRPWLDSFDDSDCQSLEANGPYTGDLGHLIACDLSAMIAQDPSTLDNLNTVESTAYPDPDADVAGTPAQFQRIFHPTVAGMQSFAENVITAYQNPVLPASPPSDPPPPPDNPAPEDNISCNLGNYPAATIGPIRDGISYLQDNRGQQFCVDGKTCGRPSCSYGTGMSVCNDGDDQICVDLGTVGDQVQSAQQFCQVAPDCLDGLCGYNYGPCCSDTVQAFQHFTTDGYNVLVQGGFDC